MKKHTPIIITVAIALVILAASTVVLIKILDVPVSIPKIHVNSLAADFSNQNELMEQWKNVRIYEVAERHDTIEDLLETVETDEVTPDELYGLFPELNKATLDKYLAEHEEIDTTNGKLFIDKVTLDNAKTTIETMDGKNVLAVDEFNKLLIIGEETTAGDIIKIAIIKDPKQLDLGVVKDLKYWSIIEKHAKDEQAILAVNANNYNWNTTGEYGIVYGAIKLHGNLIRKPILNNQLIGISKDGKLTVGDNVDISEVYNAVEYREPLIKDGVMKENTELTGKLARTAIGQTESGDIIIINVAGGVDKQNNKGATENELALLLEEYGAINGSELSNGNKSIIYWNGRVVNKTFGYSEVGIKLPTSFVVKPATLVS